MSATVHKLRAATLESPLWLAFGAVFCALLFASWGEIDDGIDALWHSIRPIAKGTATEISRTPAGVEFMLTVKRFRSCTFTPPPYGYLELPGGSRALTGIAKLSGPAQAGTDYQPGFTYKSGVWRIGPVEGAKAAILTVRYLCDGKPVFVDLVKIDLH